MQISYEPGVQISIFYFKIFYELGKWFHENPKIAGINLFMDLLKKEKLVTIINRSFYATIACIACNG